MANQCKLVQNIAGSITKSNIAKVGLGESINMYLERQNESEHSCKMIMRTVMGEKLFTDQVEGRCRGMYRVSRGYNNRPVLYGVFGNHLYLIDEDSTVYTIATLESHNTECHMTETGGYGSSWPHLIIVDGSFVYALNVGENINDQQAHFRTIDLPLRVNEEFQHIQPTHVAYLFGYLIVNDSGTDAFYTSYQYPFESRRDADGNLVDNEDNWDLFQVHTEMYKDYGFITYSEWSPDNTLALMSNGSKLYTFGTRSWQAFSFNDDKNNPFTSPDNAAGNIGIKAPNSLAMLGPTVIWLGSSDIGEDGVFMVQGTEIKRVSTQDIERELTKLKNPENAYSSIWQEHQHVFYSLTFEDSKKTFIYDISEDAWHYRASYDETNNLTFWRYSHVTFAYNRNMVGTFDNVCFMDENYYKEHDGRPILKLRKGGVLTSNDQPFYIDEIELIVNNGQHSFDNHYDNMELNPRVSIRNSWDGMLFSDYEDAYLGKIGVYDWVTSFYNMGMGKFFTLEISTTENIPFSIENLKISWQPCSNFS